MLVSERNWWSLSFVFICTYMFFFYLGCWSFFFVRCTDWNHCMSLDGVVGRQY